nr:hypothetical protein CFP56_39874 [Quercus suber]
MAERNNVTTGQYHSRILWQNAAALPQDSTIAEFYGRTQQRYRMTVPTMPQQNSVAKCSNVTTGQYRSRILWQNTATLQQDSAVAELCTAMLKQSRNILRTLQ